VEYLEKMFPHANLSFFSLGNGFGGKDLEFRAKGRGRARGESEEKRKLMFYRLDIVKGPSHVI